VVRRARGLYWRSRRGCGLEKYTENEGRRELGVENGLCGFFCCDMYYVSCMKCIYVDEHLYCNTIRSIF
jgi:hypothetical protein